MKRKYFKTTALYCSLLLLNVLISSCNTVNNNCINASPGSKCNNIPTTNSTQNINPNPPEKSAEPSPSKNSSSTQKSDLPKSFSGGQYQDSEHLVFLSNHNGKFRYKAQRKKTTDKPIEISCSSREQEGKVFLDCINGNFVYKVTIDSSKQDSIIVQVYEDGKAYSMLVLNAV